MSDDILLGDIGRDGVQGSEETYSILRGDTFLFSWAPPCERLRIELVGRDPAGEPVHDVYVFEEPEATEAAISPRRLGGGVLERVTVEGPMGPVILHRVRRPRR